ncbi:MAG: hypothetical protein M3R65_10040 [Gemmatimonadota bacterium]|nr:hypothetical protein [Gemmatimonadota bacterium]
MTTGLLILLAPVAIAAQQWDSPRADSLATHATAVRAAQLADSGLRSYKAEASGYVTFLAQLGKGFPDPPKIVRADQIASDVYWKAPALSKQLIRGRRDTLLLPTDINYHRDHLGIVQNNFPGIIRIGDGDEVQDVPHPFSAVGLQSYDFAVGDSLQIRLGDRTLDVVQLIFRPRDQKAARAIGSAYIDRASGAVVRMAIGFTRAALRDKDLEDLSVVLESGLIEGRFWLPRRQEIEIRRTGTWLDYPARGIIRGRWDISDYQVNVPVEGVFDTGPEIEAAPGAIITREGLIKTKGFHFAGTVLDSLPPDVRSFASSDVAQLHDQVNGLVHARTIERANAIALAGNSVSNFVHFDRVEGIAVGGAVTVHPAPRVALNGGASYGFSDHEWKPHAAITLAAPNGATITGAAYRTLHDVSIVPERSGLINSFAAQEYGSDYTGLFSARGGSLTLAAPTGMMLRPSLELAVEEQGQAAVHTRPATNHFAGPQIAAALREARATLHLDAPRFDLFGMAGGATLSLSAMRDESRGPGGFTVDRGEVVGTLSATRTFGGGQLAVSALAAGLTNGLLTPPQSLIYLGGPVTAPGYDFHSLVGDGAVAARAEWRLKIPFVPIPLGAWGRSPATATLAPFAHAAWIDGKGWYPSVGTGLLTVFDLLRFDVARGTRNGRWSFYVDVSRDFWGIL